MTPFPQRFLDHLRARTDFVAVVGEVVRLSPAGPIWAGRCPFHREKTASFHVSDRKGFFICFGCGASGDLFTFVGRQWRVSFPEAVRALALRAGLALPGPPDDPVATD